MTKEISFSDKLKQFHKTIAESSYRETKAKLPDNSLKMHLTGDKLNEALDQLDEVMKEQHEDISLHDKLSLEARKIFENTVDALPEEEEDTSFADQAVEEFSKQLMHQLETVAIARNVERVKSYPRIRKVLRNHDNLIAGILNILRCLRVQIPDRQYLDENHILRTTYLEFVEERTFSVEQLVKGLIYVSAIFGNNSSRMRRLESITEEMHNMVLSLTAQVKNQQDSIENISVDYLRIKELENNYLEFELRELANPFYVIHSYKKNTWLAVKDPKLKKAALANEVYPEFYVATDEFSKSLRFTSLSTTKEVLDDLIKDRQKAKKLPNKFSYAGPPNIHRYNIYEIVQKKIAKS